MKYFQQGDCIIYPVNEIPKGLEVKDDGVLQYGEHTGHMHKFIGDCRVMFRKEDVDASGNGPKYFTLNSECKLVHEEHKPIVLPPGNYVSRIVREFDHIAEEIRNVAD